MPADTPHTTHTHEELDEPPQKLSTTLILIATVLFVLVASLGTLLAWAVTAKPISAKPGYEDDTFELFMAHTESRVTNPAAARAAFEQHMLIAIQTHEIAHSSLLMDYADPSLIYAPNEDVSPRDYESLEAGYKLLEALEKIDLNQHLDALAAAPSVLTIYEQPDSARLIDVLLPHLGEQRSIARSLFARMYLNHRDANYEEFAQDFERVLALGKHVGSQALIIESLVGIAIQAGALTRLEQPLFKQDLPPETLDSLAKALEDHALSSPLQHALESERIILQDTINQTHTSSGILMPTKVASYLGYGTDASVDYTAVFTDSDELLALSAKHPVIGNLLGLTQPRADTTRQLVDDHFDALQIRFTSPTAPVTFPALGNNPLLAYMLPALSRSFNSSNHLQIQLAAYQIRIAIARYIHDHNTPPLTLQHLVPTYLDHLPTAPIHDADGQFNYSPTPIHGHPYTLYIDGPDKLDSAAKLPPDPCDMRWNNRDTPPGTDIVFTKPLCP